MNRGAAAGERAWGGRVGGVSAVKLCHLEVIQPWTDGGITYVRR